MSPRSSKPAKSKSKAKKSKGAKQSSPPDVYVGLLFVSLASLVTACIFLWIELGKYNYSLPTGNRPSAPTALPTGHPASVGAARDRLRVR